MAATGDDEGRAKKGHWYIPDHLERAQTRDDKWKGAQDAFVSWALGMFLFI